MAEYIERTEELILAVNAGARAIENAKRYHGVFYSMNAFSNNPKEISYLKAAKVLRKIDEIPAADVAPVVHGRWIKAEQYVDEDGIHTQVRCSLCGRYEDEREPYCNCGARMDGE